MSNSLAIATVTATLAKLITDGVKDLPGANVTTKPLDKAHADYNSNQVNIFLYQTVLNAAWRNMDMPRQIQPGETGRPPLALNLHYLITVYGAGDEDGPSHQLLGKAMSALHDHPVLGATDLQNVLPSSGLESQIERVRITPLPLSVDDISKLWTAFQTQYRVSTAYEVEVVLIDSTRPSSTPLPVLTRGQNDAGITAQPNLIPPFPAILDVQPQKLQPAARLNEPVTILGNHLDGDSVAVRFTTAWPLTPPLTPPAVPAIGTADQVVVTVPNDPANFPAGSYTVAVKITRAGQPDRFTNEWPLQIAPTISHIAPVSPPAGDVTITVTCSPEVRPEQRASLLFGEQEILAQPHPAQTNTLSFVVIAAAKGKYWVRLRVDGVDSLLIDRQSVPPLFDPSQQITIT